MRLYIGGAYQGKREYVFQQTGLRAKSCTAHEALHAEAIDAFHEIIRELYAKGETAEEYIRRLLTENPDAVIICNEVGMGVIPMDDGERQWRSMVGGALCALAREAEEVVRIICGIGVRIK